MDQGYLKSILDYNPESGELTWKKRVGEDRTTKSWNTRYAGKVAGSKRGSYWQLTIDDHSVKAHPIIWIWMTGEICPLIDHIDGDGMNNKWSNLRSLDMSRNIRKGKIQSNNTSGYKGVSFRSDTGRWTARCKIGGKYPSLGTFSTKEQAFSAYCAKVLEISGEIHIDLIRR